MRSFASSWSGTLNKLGFRRKRARRKTRQAIYHRRPAIESLEPRQLLSITVNTLVDENDGINVGGVSLRDAVAQAATTPSTEVILFDTSLTGGTIRLTQQLAINSDVYIIGLGVDKLTIDAQGGSRVMIVGNNNVSLSGLTLKGGSQVDAGAGVLNFGNLTLDRVHITENSTTFGNNSGGGIYSVYGSLHITNSTIDFNTATWNAGIGFYANDATDVLAISGSTISNNRAGDQAGNGGAAGVGIYSQNVGATLKMTGSTVSGNSAPSFAGVVVVGDAHPTIVNSTITNNVASNDFGGVFVNDSNSVITLFNSIVAGNISSAWGGYNRDVGRNAGSFNLGSSFSNLIGAAGFSGLTSANGIVGNASAPKDPGLAPLGDYGGPTKTHALLPTSPAIDSGINAIASAYNLGTDQRGFKRVVSNGAASPADYIVDIGAFEYGQVIATSADFDGNGYKESATYDPLTRTIVAFLGTKQLTSQVAIGQLDASRDWDSFQVGDFNGDHRDDVWFRELGTNKWSIAVSDGSRFNVSDPAAAVATGAWATTYTGDFDGDGAKELLGWNGSIGQWEVLDYDDRRGNSVQAWGSALGTGMANLEIGDANGDGREDLVAYYPTWQKWVVALSQLQPNGTDTFAFQGNSAYWGDWFGNWDIASLGVAAPYQKVIDIYSHVYNTIDVEFYPGLMKGPTATEETKAGNAWDQAALLLQLLDAAGFEAAGMNAGTIRATEDETLAWLGAKDATAALDILHAAIDDNAAYNSTAHTFTFRSAWVTLPVPVSNGLDWIILDPSWKFRNFQPGVALSPDGGSGLLNSFDTFAKQFLFTKEDGKFVKSQLPIEAYEDQVMNYLATTPALQGKSLADVAYDGPIIQQQFKQIPAANKQRPSPPSLSDSVGYYWDEFDSWTPQVEEFYTNPSRSAQWAHRVSITINGSIEQIINVPQHSLDQISIWYTNGAPGMVVPHLSVGSQTPVSMSPVAANSVVTIVVKHLDPTKYQTLLGSLYQHTDTYSRKAGQIVVVSLEANQYSSGRIAQMQADLSNQLAIVGSGYSTAVDKDDIDDVLAYVGAKYWYNFNRDSEILTALSQTVDVQQRVGSGLITADSSFNSATNVHAHLDVQLVPDGMFVDLANGVVSPHNLKTPNDLSPLNLDAFRFALFNGSALEHATLEEVIDSPSISTVNGIQLYLDSGQTPPGSNVRGLVVERNPEDTSFNPGEVPQFKVVAKYDSTGLHDTLPEMWTEGQLRAALVDSFEQTVIDKLNTPHALNRLWVPTGKTTIAASAGGPGWDGTVYIYETFATDGAIRLSYAIQRTGDAPASGGYRYGAVSAPKPIPPATFTNQSYSGDPVGPANGNMSRDELDFKFANPILPMDFARHYDSQNTLGVGFAVGWVHSFTGIIYQDSVTDDKRYWLRGNGERVTFDNNGYELPHTLFGKITASGGVLSKFQDKDGLEYTFESVNFDEYAKHIIGRLVSIKDAAGNATLTITYDGASTHVSRVQSSASSGRHLDFAYLNGNGVSLTQYENNTLVSTWVYNFTRINGLPSVANTARLTQVLHAGNTSIATNYQYYEDGASARRGLIKSIAEPNGETHKYEYYANGRVFRVFWVDEANKTHQQTYNYNLYRNLTEATDERGNVETYIFQDNGLTTKQIHPDRSRLEFTWGATNSPEEFLMTSSTDELGAKETFSYVAPNESNYHPGDLKQSIAKDGLVTNYDYAVVPDAYVSRLSKVIIDPDAATGSKITTQYFYDNVGNLLSFKDAEDNPTHYEYYGASDGAYKRGLRKSDTLPNEIETVYEYDTAGNIIKATTDNLPTTIRTYDTFGNIKTEVDPTGVVTYNNYDALGRFITTVVNASQHPDPVGVSTTTISYDPWRIETTTDALGRATTNLYDANSRLVERKFADGTWTKHDYDEVGNCIAITDELGRTTQFVYDDRNRVIQTIYADGSSARTQYDGAGRVVESIDENGHSTTFKYDRMGRLIETSQLLIYPESSTTATLVRSTNQYDYLGNLVKVTDPNGNVTINQFDKLGHIVETRMLDRDDVTTYANPNVPPVALATTTYNVNGQVEARTVYDTSMLGNAIPTKYVNPAINFEDSELQKFQGQVDNLDTLGSPKVIDGGRTLVLDGNSSKAAEVNYKITAATVIEFDFKEIDPSHHSQLYGIGVTNNLTGPNATLIKVLIYLPPHVNPISRIFHSS